VIALILERGVPATRQLASRARRRVRGAETASTEDVIRNREVVTAFLTASREGSFETLLTLLDPDVVWRADRVAVSRGVAEEIRGAASVGRLLTGRTRLGTRFARSVLVDGTVGVVVAPRGRLLLLLRLMIRRGKIVEIEVVADPAHLHQVRLAVPDD
jgi:RNA polymerase sigma-70 factor (ECF subfamily)